MPIHATSSSWIIETNQTGYAIGLNNAGLLTHRYWRERLPQPSDYPPAPNPVERASFDMPAHYTPEEYPGYSALRYIDPAIKITFADGVRDLVPEYVDYSVSDGLYPELSIHLRDAYYPVKLTLHYRAYEKYDLISRWVTMQRLCGW